MKRFTYLLFFSCFFAGCNHETAKQNPEVASVNNGNFTNYREKDISLIPLIANPDKYEGKTIRVIGYLHLEFEGNVLYFHKDDYANAIDKNGIWVDVKRSAMDGLKKYSDHYVIMEGIFDSRMQGHEAMNSGSIKNITRLDLWEPAK